MMDTQDLIARAEASLEGVTPGPWVVIYERGCTHLKMADQGSQMCDETYYPWVPENLKDWDFFASARQDVPDLIAALRAERESREQAEAMVAAAYRDAAESLSECCVWCDSQDRMTPQWINGSNDARKHHMAHILARTPANTQAALGRMCQSAADAALERAAQEAQRRHKENTGSLMLDMANAGRNAESSDIAAAIRVLKGSA